MRPLTTDHPDRRLAASVRCSRTDRSGGEKAQDVPCSCMDTQLYTAQATLALTTANPLQVDFLANMTVRVYLSRSRRCPLKVSTWIVSIAGRRSCPAAGSISSRLFFLTPVALVVTYLGRDLQQMMDRIFKALHPNMCIKPAAIIVEGYTQCWGQPNCLPGVICCILPPSH
jgi:hypothetical protein